MSILLSNFYPSSSIVSPDVVISFDLTSDGDPIDISTVNVWFEEGASPDANNSAILSGVEQDGYNVSIYSTTVSGNSGYHVSILPSRSIRSSTIAVLIRADTDPASGVTNFRREFATATYGGTIVSVSPILAQIDVSAEEVPLGFTFSGRNFNALFQINDVNEPTITNRIPVVNSINNEVDTDITFSLHDYGAVGINITTLYVWIDGALAISGGSFVYPYSGTIFSATVDFFYDGFDITIEMPSSFLYLQWVSVRVRVKDLASDPTAVNTLDTTYSFRTREFISLSGPGAEPTQPPTGLGLDSCIEFDWLDEPQGPGPIWDTLSVTLRREKVVSCITSVRDDIAVVNGVAASGYTVYANEITVGLRIGFHVWVCPEVPFNESEIVTVIISGEDESGSQSTTSFEVSTSELTPPTVLNLNPANGETGVATNSEIYFEMHDSAGSGVDVSSTDVKINGADVVIDGVAQAGYSLSVVNDTIVDEYTLEFDGYEFTITPDNLFEPGTDITVVIDGYDAYGNHSNTSYTFSTESHTTPPVVSLSPEDGATGMNRDQNIIIDATDDFDIDTSSLNVWVNETLVISSGTSTSLANLTSEQIVNGVRFIVSMVSDFSFGDEVGVRATVSDIYDNSSTATTSFSVFVDTTSPSITNVSPRDGQREVSLSPTITFSIRDGYDVTRSSINVTLNSDFIVKEGLIQTGYSLITDRIGGLAPGVDPGNGYTLYITKDTPFEYSQTVEINVVAHDDVENNEVDETITWYTVDPVPPRIESVITDGETEVGLDTNIEIRIYSDGYGVDIDTLNVILNDVSVVVDNVGQEPDFTSVTTTVIADGYYCCSIDPRYLLSSSSKHTLKITVQESTFGNANTEIVNFWTTGPMENPETLYIGGSNGVSSIATGQIDGYTSPTVLFGSYYVHDIISEVLREINYLAVATRDDGAMLYSTNYDWPTRWYSSGDEITKLHLSTTNNGTLYLANRTKRRVDVYYDILGDDNDRSTPDIYYAPINEAEGFDGYAVEGIVDGYFTDMVVTEGTSSVDDVSNTIFLGTPYGVFKIDTDESSPGGSETNGVLTSYGKVGGNATYKILAGNTDYVSAIDVNVRLNQLYVATRAILAGEQGALTYIDLETNTRSGVILEANLIHKLINDINFKD